MEQVKIPDDQVTPMDAIAPGIKGLRIIFVNVFSVSHADGSWTLIDAGMPFSETLIRKWAEKHFSIPPRSIVLTHGHFDHVSAAPALAEAWGVPVFAHPLEFPYLRGEKEYPPPNTGAGGGLMSLLSPLYPRGPVNLGAHLRSLPATADAPATLFELPGWEALHTPGHTPGHISLFRPADGTLLPGDAFCTTKPESFFEAALAQQPEMRGPPAYFTSDWDTARQSVRRLARLDPKIVAPGHGKPLSGDHVADALHRLAANFDAIAVPHKAH
jgi:glyoxylase-like metal-dependent hydrolase (beta-lactamase superfamily II)